jgi:hypothetical protein
MAGTGIWSFAKFRGQMPWIATTGINSWQTALKWTADCQVPRSGCRGQVNPVAIRSQIHTSVCGNLHDDYSILGNPRIATIRGTHLSAELGKLPPFYIESPPYLFTARLLEYKIPTRRIVDALTKHQWSQLIHVSRDTIPLTLNKALKIRRFGNN